MRASCLIVVLLSMGCFGGQRGWAGATEPAPVAYSPGWQAPSYEPVPPPQIAPASPGDGAAAFAMHQFGKPYCWGGSGPGCYDCSGLTSAAWRAAGKSIPRTSEAQRDALDEVDMNELRPGDILWRPGHVGLYVGNGWAIHAPETGKTVAYQPANRYREARRP